ncbi:MAG: hypothetical protein ACI4Q9_05285 [Candidatus Methanomethylophilaceae archaeon]
MKQNGAFMRRRLNKNKKGGIEGLPLQLLIIIVIASIGLTTMVGWMNNIEEPSTIDDAGVTVKKMGSYYDVTVSAYDNNGNAVSDADVVITGLGAKNYSYSTNSVPTGKTGSTGSVTLRVTLNSLDTYGYLNVEISKPGMSTYKTSVLVTK